MILISLRFAPCQISQERIYWKLNKYLELVITTILLAIFLHVIDNTTPNEVFCIIANFSAIWPAVGSE